MSFAYLCDCFLLFALEFRVGSCLLLSIMLLCLFSCEADTGGVHNYTNNSYRGIIDPVCTLKECIEVLVLMYNDHGNIVMSISFLYHLVVDDPEEKKYE